MQIERHYDKNGTPAYVILWRVGNGTPDTFLRLVYRSAPEFDSLWAEGTDWTELVLDIP